jgi:hypothetical protein
MSRPSRSRSHHPPGVGVGCWAAASGSRTKRAAALQTGYIERLRYALPSPVLVTAHDCCSCCCCHCTDLATSLQKSAGPCSNRWCGVYSCLSVDEAPCYNSCRTAQNSQTDKGCDAGLLHEISATNVWWLCLSPATPSETWCPNHEVDEGSAAQLLCYRCCAPAHARAAAAVI